MVRRMSIICKKCGAENPEETKFCSVCGCPVESENYEQQQSTQQFQQQFQSQGQQEQIVLPRGNGLFVDETEVPLASLRNGAIMNIISGEGFRKEDAIITNKRLYYRHKDGIINIKEEECIVNVDDITGAKIMDVRRYILLVFAALNFLSFFIAIVGMSNNRYYRATGEMMASVGSLATMGLFFVIMFFVLRKKHLTIEYAGGRINFSVKKYGMDKIREFQRCIYAVKDISKKKDN